MGLQKWIAKIAFTKVAKRLIALLVGFLLSAPVQSVTSGLGITIDETAMVGGLYGLVELARNFLKTKFDLKWL